MVQLRLSQAYVPGFRAPGAGFNVKDHAIAFRNTIFQIGDVNENILIQLFRFNETVALTPVEKFDTSGIDL